MLHNYAYVTETPHDKNKQAPFHTNKKSRQPFKSDVIFARLGANMPFFKPKQKSSPKDLRAAQVDLHLNERRLEALKRRELAGDDVLIERSIAEVKTSILRQRIDAQRGGAR